MTDDGVVEVGSEVAFERRDGVRIHFGAIGSKTPIAIEAGEGGIPLVGLLEEFGGLGEVRGFGAHHAQIIVGAGENF